MASGPPMDDLLTQAMESPGDVVLLDPTTSANAMVFVLVTLLGVVMALIYVPLRLFLTLTARSRRLRLLQRIRQLREELGRPVASTSSPGSPGSP
jgi:hypothetical protein